MAEQIRPGAETLAINTFTKSATWEGKLPAGALGMNAPEMATKGHVTCKWTVNDLWLVCEIEDQMGTGEHARVWKAVWVSGWDFGLKEYRGALFDSFGNSSMMRGTRDGHLLTFESLDDVIMHGQRTRLRFTFDASEPKGVWFTAEHSVNGTYVVDEREQHIPIATR
jgi:hypothetical protein